MERKSSLDKYYKTLVGLRNTIDSLYKEDILYKFSSDSTVLMRYAERLTVVLQEIQPIDSSLKKILFKVSDLQPTVNRMVNRLSTSIEQIGAFQQELFYKQFHRETSNLGGPVKYVRRFKEIISFSLVKGWLSFIFYVRNEIGKIFLLAILIIACTTFLLALSETSKNKTCCTKTIANNPHSNTLSYLHWFIVLNVFQFAFIDPPFIFNMLIWIISALSLTFILKNIVATVLDGWLVDPVFFFSFCLFR
jgi:hypothetical protein